MSGLADLSDLQTPIPSWLQAAMKIDPGAGVYSAREEGHDDWWIASAGRRQIPFAAINHAHHHLMADQPVALATGIEAMSEAIGAS